MSRTNKVKRRLNRLVKKKLRTLQSERIKATADPVTQAVVLDRDLTPEDWTPVVELLALINAPKPFDPNWTTDLPEDFPERAGHVRAILLSAQEQHVDLPDEVWAGITPSCRAAFVRNTVTLCLNHYRRLKASLAEEKTVPLPECGKPYNATTLPGEPFDAVCNHPVGHAGYCCQESRP